MAVIHKENGMKPLFELRRSRWSRVMYFWRSPRRLVAVAVALQWRAGYVRTPFVRVWCAGPFMLAITDLDRR